MSSRHCSTITGGLGRADPAVLQSRQDLRQHLGQQNRVLDPPPGRYQIERDIELNTETRAALEDGRAVVVVHGLDPATLSAGAQAAPSDLGTALPLAATSPALCGKIFAQDSGDKPGRGDDNGKQHGHRDNHQHFSWHSHGGGWHHSR